MALSPKTRAELAKHKLIDAIRAEAAKGVSKEEIWKTFVRVIRHRRWSDSEKAVALARYKEILDKVLP